MGIKWWTERSLTSRTFKGTKSGKATLQSVQESFDARPGNQLGDFGISENCGLVSVLIISWNEVVHSLEVSI